MNKISILFTLLLGLLSTNYAMADRIEIPSQVSTNANNEGNADRDRASMRIPLSIYYDTETNIVELEGPEGLQAQVVIFNEHNEIESISYELNSSHFISEPGLHTILIQGEGWTAIGIFIN